MIFLPPTPRSSCHELSPQLTSRRLGRRQVLRRHQLPLALRDVDDDTGAENNHGSAYIFERHAGGAENWGQVKKLGASDAATNDRFGQSVSIDGDERTKLLRGLAAIDQAVLTAVEVLDRAEACQDSPQPMNDL